MRDDRVFLDTSGWIALLSSGDANHPAAVAAWREVIQRRAIVVLTDRVVAETGNGLAGTPLRIGFAGAARYATSNPEFQIVEVDRALLMRAIDLYGHRPDKGWGLVDCASFVVMADLGIRDALTADRHFEQAGFRALLREPSRSG